jgi:hypothetical protein
VSEVKFWKENNCRVRYLSDEEESRLFSVIPEEYKPLVTNIQAYARVSNLI